MGVCYRQRVEKEMGKLRGKKSYVKYACLHVCVLRSGTTER